MDRFASQPPTPRVSFSNLAADPRIQLGIVILLAMTINFSKLGGSGLANYDDCFYAQKAKEILSTREWMTMHYNHQAAWENPPFFMWLIALSYKLFGINEYAAKFPSALSGLATTVLVYVIARKFYDAWVAFFSSLVLATTFIFTRYARHAMMDVTLSFFVCLSLYALVLALERHRLYFLLWGVCIGVCVLIKSVLGLYPLLVTVGFLLLTRQWRMFFDKYFIVSCIIILISGPSWYVDQYLKFGQQFIDAHFGWVIYTRGFALEQQAWYEHLTYLEDLLKYYWPWLPVFFVGLVNFSRKIWRGDKHAILLTFWSTAIVVGMSCMQSRVLWYIMPMFPAAAIICGYTLNTFLSERQKLLAAKVCFVLTGIVMIVLNASPLRIESERERDVREIAPYVRYFARDGAKVVAFRQDYYGLNNALQFYSDYAAYPIFQDCPSISQAFERDSLVLCVINADDIEEVGGHVQTFHLIRRTNGLALGANRVLDISRVNGNQ